MRFQFLTNRPDNKPFLPILLLSLLMAGCATPSRDQSVTAEQARNQEWPVYGGNKAGNRYSPLRQINTQNVQGLKVAWTYNTGDNTRVPSTSTSL